MGGALLGEALKTKMKIKGITYKIGDIVVYDSPHGWQKGIIATFASSNQDIVWLKVEGTTVLQKVQFRDIRPTAPIIR